MTAQLARLCLAAALAAPAGLACTAHAPPPVDPHADEVLLRYRLGPQKYDQHLSTAVKTGSDAMLIELTGRLSLDAIGSMLRLDYEVTDVARAEASGSFATTTAPAFDLAGRLRSTRGAHILDVRGVVDKPASKQLSADAAKTEEYTNMLGLPPDLPEAPLVVGVPLVVAHTEREEFAGLELDLEKESTYTMRALTVDAGRRIAEVDIHGTWSGAHEIAGQAIALEGSRDDTLAFDVDAQVPIRLTSTAVFTIILESSKTTIEINATSIYTPLAPLAVSGGASP